ncbi:MAG: hypothetical protein HY763_04560 [Planctomycetes bacterium]|nr:hypothetical protein [Planctomycetota bacterium]
MERTVAILAYLAAAWPVVLFVALAVPAWKRGRIPERRWILLLSTFAAFIAVSLVLHWLMPSAERGVPRAVNRWGLGWRSELEMTPLERWLVLGVLVVVAVALRSFVTGKLWEPTVRRWNRT